MQVDDVELRYASFNSNFSRIAIGKDSGFAIYKVDPFTIEHDSEIGGCSIVEVLNSTKLAVSVGSDDSPTTSSRRLQCWNTRHDRLIHQVMFRTPILAVKINSNRIVVVRETELSLYSVADMALLATLETPPNPRGVCAISESSIIAYPSQSDKGEYVLYDALALRVKRVVSAHKERLRCLAFSPDASLIASASESGAWVKISPVDEKDGRIWQFRRGISPALIDSIAFNEEQSLLCCSSPNGTVHIFRVPPNPEAMTTPHNGNGNSPVGMGYLNSLFPDAGLRAAATIKFTPGLNSLCGFSPDSTRVYTVTSDGKFCQYQLDFASHSCKLVQEHDLLGKQRNSFGESSEDVDTLSEPEDVGDNR